MVNAGRWFFKVSRRCGGSVSVCYLAVLVVLVSGRVSPSWAQNEGALRSTGQLSAQTDDGTAPRPNILVLVSDDMGRVQPGFNGGTEVTTPNMDRIADEGVKLTQFYVQPVCGPTRASLFTGRYAWKTGMADNPDNRTDDGLLLDERTIAEALRDSSYATWLVGKWHAGLWGSERLPLQRGFDHHYGFYNGFIDSYKHVRPWRGWHEISDWHRNGRPVVESGYSTFLLAEEASQLIERHDGSRPFFLYVAFNAPHDPYQAPPEYIAQFSHLPYNLETRKQRAMVKAMDDAIGQVMDALERRGVLDETLVMFLNDNGAGSEAGGNSPYRGLKRSYLEGGIRVPAVMRWPGKIPAGSESDALLHVVDLFPTFTGLAGADTGGGLPLDGLDVWEAIANGAESPRQEVVHSLDVIRVGDWKLLEEDGEFAKGDKSSPLQLYNIAEDPYETTNLASSETARVAELRERLVYHRPFARDAEPGVPIPGLDSIDSTDDRPVMFGAEENTAFGAEVETALTQRQAGNLGPALLRLEASGASLKLIYNETLDAASVPPADAFTVVVNPGYRPVEVTEVEVGGGEVALTLAQEMGSGDIVGLTYEVPASGAIRDVDGLAANGVTWAWTETVPPPTVELEVARNLIREDGDTTTLTATLSHPSSAETEVAVTELLDAFELNINPLTIARGAWTSSAMLTAVDNDMDAQDREVTITGQADNALGVGQPAPVTLTIIDNDPPAVRGDRQKDYTEGNTGPVATYTATNPANISLEWSLDGAAADKEAFTIQNGVLSFKDSPDYEASKKVYVVTVRASDTTSISGVTLTGSLPVTVTVEDAPGWVDLPPTLPQVGTPLTATLTDPDGVSTDPAPVWCWERSLLPIFSPADTTDADCTSATTATYTPVDDDLRHYLRATAHYTDGQETAKTEPAAGATTETVSARGRPPPPPPPPVTGGGGGGPACAEDLHGNSAAQATSIALATETAGALCPAADVDYFTVPAPGRGLVFVDTFGGVQTRGTIWQNDMVLASDSTGRQPDDRLGALVQAGPVVVAVQGQGGANGPYDVVVTFVQGYLENPGPNSFQSGIGVVSGWVCAATVVEIELNGVPQEAAYGTARVDTQDVCGDTDNGFGLLFNWNLLGDGEHEVVALVDGIELARATVTVTTLGAEFLRGAEGACTVADFPLAGEAVRLLWQESKQNFVLAATAAPSGANRAGTAGVGFLENPSPNSFQSGVGVLSGWVCEADTVEFAIGTAGRQVAAYGTERLDTLDACGDTNNGFGLLFNWNLLGEGEHEVVAYVDDEELGRATVRVTTLGAEFLRGVEGECTVEDFPLPGETVTLAWQQNQQNFVMTQVE